MKYFRYILTSVVVLLLFGGAFYYLTFTGQIEKNPISNTLVAAARPYPALTNPKEVVLSCDFHGKNLSVSETLYGSLYDYYRSDPAKKTAYLHNGEKDFVFYYEKDNTIKDLAGKITVLGAENGLVGDQVLDLSACLMQNIPYDEAKAARILGPDFSKQPIAEVIPRYPYETLYDKTGICTDKTYLGAAVIKELGYSTAIMTFDAQKHMSLGVAVSMGYGSFATNYGILELTGSGFLVGDVPDINAGAGLAINNYQTIPEGGAENSAVSQLQLAAPSNVISVSVGNVYQRVVERTATKQKIEELKVQLTAAQGIYQQAQNTLKGAESSLSLAEKAYQANPTEAGYGAYTRAYNSYSADYNVAQREANAYNKLVNVYNSYIEKYRQF